jgi:hypothetical protein
LHVRLREAAFARELVEGLLYAVSERLEHATSPRQTCSQS